MISSLLSRIVVVRYAMMRSFWFVPGMMTLTAVALALVTRSYAGAEILESFFQAHKLIVASPEATRTILATTVGSIITVTSLVFSMVLLALSRASQQLGPRLLQDFTGDKVNQVVLGAFVATFVHALLTLAITPDPIPPAAVAISILLVLACFFMLIYFLNHTARFMQADYVLARLNDELRDAIKAGCPARDHATPAMPDWAESDDGDAIAARRSGYIQSVDGERLVSVAADRGLRLRLDVRPGHFVIAGSVIGRASPAGQCDASTRAAIADAVVIGSVRTAAEDLEFSIKAMAEIALRALSTGINDTYTAVTAIDQLSASLAVAMQRQMPQNVFVDDKGGARLVRSRVSFDGLVDAAYNPIRQNLAGNVTGIIRLVDALGELGQFVAEPHQAAVLLRHLDMMASLARRTVQGDRDAKEAAQRVNDARRRIARGREAIG